MASDLDLANQALAMISARNMIASFVENTVEAKNVTLFYNKIRDQVMTMAWWNFARRTEQLSLLKAAPGTPINSGPQVPWTADQPAPPWLYEYRYPSDCLLFRYITFRPNALPTQTQVAPLSSTILSSDSWWPGPPQKFIIATDHNIRTTVTNALQNKPCTIAFVNTGIGGAQLFMAGDRVTLTDIPGMVELNANTYILSAVSPTAANLMDLNGAPVDATQFHAYTLGTSGVARGNPVRCILTNTQEALGCYNAQINDPNDWPMEFSNAFVAALAAFIAYPITGKLDLKQNLLNEANGMIIEARKSDGNEGITSQDSTPDWMRVRGMRYQDWWGTGGVGWDQGAYTPYPPLFAVS